MNDSKNSAEDSPKLSQQAVDQIPVVDITALRDGSDPIKVAEALHEANTGLGFIYITGHGISEQLIASVQSAGMSFFRSDVIQKNTVPVTPSHRGWIKQGNAKMHDDAKSDLKESFIWGYQSERRAWRWINSSGKLAYG